MQIIITPLKISEILFELVSKEKKKSPQIIKINDRNLERLGELSFPVDINCWKNYINTSSENCKKSKDILQYCSFVTHSNFDFSSDFEVFSDYISEEIKKVWSGLKVKLKLYSIKESNFVGIFLDKCYCIFETIKTVIKLDVEFGRKKTNSNKRFKLIEDADNESTITNNRLKKLVEVSSNFLDCQGFVTQDQNEGGDKYVFTTNSGSKVLKFYKIYLCGPVLNSKSGRKEIDKTFKSYEQEKFHKVELLNSQRELDLSSCNFEKNIERIVKASINYELISTKHNQPVILNSCDKIDVSIREASFALYNNVRMKAILAKSDSLTLSKDVPGIIPIDQFENFEGSHLLEEWDLIYNFVMKYPDVLNSCVEVEPKLQINIYHMWSFVSRLCHSFSKYYRRNRVLMTGHKDIAIITSQRVHMIRALQIVLRNCLQLLDLEETTEM